MDLMKAESIMIMHGVALRAIPKRVISILEKYHTDKYPMGIVKYIDDYKREMLVVEDVPQNAGKFIFEIVNSKSSTVKFFGNKYYDSIEEALEDVLALFG